MRYANRRIQRVAVLGAGVMGAQIAAHLANASIPVTLFELPAKEGDPNGNVNAALKALSKLKPAPLAAASVTAAITPANYDQHLDLLRDCDLVIEAITERMDWKRALYEQITGFVDDTAILASNTSGLSIAELAEALPAGLRPRFCGVHFFNPPRYMHLLELIPGSDTDAEVLDTLEGFFTTSLGKGVVRALDTPSFIANRVGMFAMLSVLHHAARLELPFDLVDKLTGAGIGRPKSATLRTADVVGLDTFVHVARSMYDNLPDDPWREYYQPPAWLAQLVDDGVLGQKTGGGVYRKVGKEIHVLELAGGDYRRVRSALDDQVRAVLKDRDPASKFAALEGLDHPQAEFLRAMHLDLFHYSAYWLADIAGSARDVDFAMRWGYGWQLGPFEIWQAAGWQKIAAQLEDGIAAGRTMSSAPLPAWVTDGREGVHTAEGSWSASAATYVAPSSHPVYQRQEVPERVLGEPAPASETVFEDDAVRCWHSGDDLAVLSFKTRMHSVSAGVLEGIHRALEIAESDFKALILWQPSAPFSVGANLKEAMQALEGGAADAIPDMVRRFQQTSLALRHSPVPTVAAVQGMVFGGGCEFMLHCDRTVAALESYIGLVEAGVGLIPGAGGSKEMAMRAADQAGDGQLLKPLGQRFETLAMAKVSASALEARAMGFLRPSDPVVFNTHELLYVAKRQAEALYESDYRPPLPRTNVRVAGAAGAATLKALAVNMLEGGFISEHDFHVAGLLADIMCGGDVAAGSEVSESWLMRLELDAFTELAAHPKSQARIMHTLETGKPLRN